MLVVPVCRPKTCVLQPWSTHNQVKVCSIFSPAPVICYKLQENCIRRTGMKIVYIFRYILISGHPKSNVAYRQAGEIGKRYLMFCTIEKWMNKSKWRLNQFQERKWKWHNREWYRFPVTSCLGGCRALWKFSWGKFGPLVGPGFWRDWGNTFEKSIYSSNLLVKLRLLLLF